MRLVACFWPQDYFPEWGRGKRTSVYASKDGSAWRLRATVSAQFWSTLFVHEGGLGGQGGACGCCEEARMLMRGWPCLLCLLLYDGYPSPLPLPFGCSPGASPCRLPARPPSFHANRPPTACHAGAAYLLGVDDAEGPNSVSIARSTDGGASWNRSSLLPAPAGCHWATGAGEGCSA